MKQRILNGTGILAQIPSILGDIGAARPLLICGHIADEHALDKIFSDANIPFAYFRGYTSNPLYEDVCHGVEVFNNGGFDSLIAVGGGSAIDVAKCIKLFCKMDNTKNYIQQEYKDNDVPLIAIPTTAGTGSESTRFAVIYYNGEKQSITHDSIMPNIALLDARFLKTLPVYQKKCTMLDALCQGIESWWSVNSTEESKEYSRVAVELIFRNMKAYIDGGNEYEHAAGQIMSASNYAGRAINITQTTAPHAMSYKLTSIYHIPHGHAVAVCLPKVWRYMLANKNNIVDPRGVEYLISVFNDIASSLDCDSAEQAIIWFEELLSSLNITYPHGDEMAIETLSQSVNPVRLKNNPVGISHKAFSILYKQIVKVN